MSESSQVKKHPVIVSDNLLGPQKEHFSSNSLQDWLELYFSFCVACSPKATIKAKKRDLSLFANFFCQLQGRAGIDLWTPSLTKAFQREMSNSYKATTARRTMASLSHFCRWVGSRRRFLVGNPFEGVRAIQIEETAWKGLTTLELARLRAGCDIRLAIAKRKMQNPLMEAAVFYTLLNTGLREMELTQLNIGQFQKKVLLDVKRKGERISKRVPLSSEAKDYLNQYLKKRGPLKDNEPLFISRNKKRLDVRDIGRICERICKAAPNHVYMTPHMLRHTFLKRVADKHGVHVAQRLSGNSSTKEIFRYTKPSDEETQAVVEGLY